MTLKENLNVEFEGRSEYSERRDCVVRAFTVVSGKPYIEVLNEFSAAGRKPRHGTKSTISTKIANTYGWRKVTCRMTVGKFLDNIKYTGPVVARVRGHMFAVVDGKIADICPVGLKRIVTYYYTNK